MMKLKFVSLAASIGLLGALLFYSDFSKVLEILSRSSPLLVGLALAFSTLPMVSRAFRWKLLLKKIGIGLPISRVFPVFMAGLFISNVTPARSGEPFRSYLLKKREGIGFSNSISSVIIERVFDLLTLIAVSAAGILLVQGFFLAAILNLVIVVYLAFIAFAVTVCTSRKRVEAFSRFFVRLFGWLPVVKRAGHRIEDKAGNINESFMKYRSWPGVATLLIVSIFIWLLDGAVGYIAFRALGIEVDLLLFTFIMAVSVLIGIATSLPGGIGSADAVMALLASGLFGISLPLATAGILLFRFLTIWYDMAVGAFFLGVSGK